MCESIFLHNEYFYFFLVHKAFCYYLNELLNAGLGVDCFCTVVFLITKSDQKKSDKTNLSALWVIVKVCYSLKTFITFYNDANNSESQPCWNSSSRSHGGNETDTTGQGQKKKCIKRNSIISLGEKKKKRRKRQSALIVNFGIFFSS